MNSGAAMKKQISQHWLTIHSDVCENLANVLQWAYITENQEAYNRRYVIWNLDIERQWFQYSSIYSACQ